MTKRKEEKKKLRVLMIEPYYGGSHKSFLDGLIGRLPHEVDLMELPARKWMWRMRLSAPYFADLLHSLGREYDVILCSTFIDVASFRGLSPEWVRRVPVLTYFHENQFEYPVQVGDERDLHFALTNLTTALASDRIAFNSKYNLETFLKGVEDILKVSYDLKLNDPCGAIRSRASVIHPAIDFSSIDEVKPQHEGGSPVVLWNHRWEHDKDPDTFFKALFKLDAEGLDFGVVVLGESFTEIPPIFNEAKARLSGRILHMGYVKDRRDYASWLRRSTIAVSTAQHEFFGIAAVEAARAGCVPLVPRRLSYPELFDEKFLYDDRELLTRLRNLIILGKRLSDDEAREMTEPYSWSVLAKKFERWLCG
ncbi:MAG: DUF3524 domain-containing protein [Nitrospirota bacterium]|nr:MAG: DUF3524 domain-containing protein [Nitrospirota bacterium]